MNMSYLICHSRHYKIKYMTMSISMIEKEDNQYFDAIEILTLLLKVPGSDYDDFV